MFPPVIIIPPSMSTHFHLDVTVTRRTKGRILGTVLKAMLFRKSGSDGIENKFPFYSPEGLVLYCGSLSSAEARV